MVGLDRLGLFLLRAEKTEGRPDRGAQYFEGHNVVAIFFLLGRAVCIRVYGLR